MLLYVITIIILPCYLKMYHFLINGYQESLIPDPRYLKMYHFLINGYQESLIPDPRWMLNYKIYIINDLIVNNNIYFIIYNHEGAGIP